MTSEVSVRKENGIAPAADTSLLSLITKGNLNGMSDDQVIQVYVARCESIGVDPRTQPFDVLVLNGAKRLYPNSRLAEQLIQRHRLSTTKTREETTPEGIRIVEVEVSDALGRKVSATGALFVKALTGQPLADAWMKCETKATRRAVLRFCGLGQIAEQPEIEDVQYTVRQSVDVDTGEITSGDDDLAEKERVEALKYLHAAGNDAGLTHEQLRAFAQKHFPDIESLTELGTGDLTALADAVRAAVREGEHEPDPVEAEYVDAETGDVVADDDAASPVPDFLAKINKAATLDELQAVAAQLKDAGISNAALRAKWANRAAQLARTENAEQPDLMQVERPIDDRMPV